MSDFLSSTHCSNWIFTTEELLKRKKTKHYRLRNCVANLVAEKLVNANRDIAPADAGALLKYYRGKLLSTPGAETKIASFELLNPQMESMYLNYFCERIIDLSKTLSIPVRVKNCALMMFRRFFLVKSIYTYEPSLIMIVCIVVASKVEEMSLNIVDFLSKIKDVSPEDVLDHEIDLLRAINFQLQIYSPYRALQGIQTMFEIDDSFLKAQVEPLIDRAFYTDVIFLHTPGVIAAAALNLAKPEWIHMLRKSIPLADFEKTLSLIQEASKMLSQARETEKILVKDLRGKINKFIKFCPEFKKYTENKRRDELMGNDAKRIQAEQFVELSAPSLPKKSKE